MNNILPHNDVENILVHILLTNPEKILTKHIEARWFTKNRRIIENMLILASKGITIDVFTVSDAMGAGMLEKLIDVARNGLGAPENYAFYVDDMRATYEARIIKTAIEFALCKIKEGIRPSEVISDLISESMEASSLDGKTNIYAAKEAMQLCVTKLDEVFEAKEAGGIGLKTGIKLLDKHIVGMQPSDLTVVGARPGVGKTSFALSVLRNLAKSGKKVGFFSTEMSVEQVMSRFLSIEGNIPSNKIRSADIDEEEWPRITLAASTISKLDFRICDKPVITVGELSMQARAWKADGGIDFIAIDYLTRIHPDKSKENRAIEVGNIVTSLKNLARNLNIPVMVLAQLNRGNENRADKSPVMSDLRDSGVIEQEADQILMLYRPDQDNSNNEKSPEIIIEKNRHGECGVVRCLFDPATMHWTNFYNQD